MKAIALSLSLLICCLAAAPASQPTPSLRADAPANVRAYFERAIAERPAVIAAAKKELAAIRAGRIDRKLPGPFARPDTDRQPWKFRDSDIKREHSLKAMDRLKEVFAPDFIPEIEMKGFEVGAVGRLEYSQVHVVQVIDGQALLVHPNEIVPVYGRDADGHEITIGKTLHESDLILWVSMDTTGIISDQVVDLTGLYEVAGTKTYATADGASNTVLELRPVKIDEYIVRR